MHRFTLDPDGLATYATTTARHSATLTAATTRAAAAGPLLLAPALGLVGADFLTAYGAAHTTHLTTLESLATALTSLALATTTAATTCAATDITHATALRATTQEVLA
ncbi:type VII secretion target [Nocardia sp. NPDC020380]|uniref:type VII secretion target n=1 Tax=Nocardia sp. NPDC020380 TaxID=3364309 RepID=UPI0037991FFD